MTTVELSFLLLLRNTMVKQIGEETVYFSYISRSLFIIEGSQDRNSNRAGTWRQELMKRPSGAVYWLSPCGLLGMLSDRTQDHQPRSGPTHNGLGPPTSIFRKMPYSLIL